MHNFESFTLEHYKAVFDDPRLLVILINTVIIALLSSAYCNDSRDSWSDWYCIDSKSKNAQYASCH